MTKYISTFLMMAVVVFALNGCAEDQESSTSDVLKIVNDDPAPQPFAASPEPSPSLAMAPIVVEGSRSEKPIPVEARSSAPRTECFGTGVSKTSFTDQGREATVTFVRANYFVALAHVQAKDSAVYDGEVEIILPEQSRVYNITKNGAFFLLRDNGQFAFMADLVRSALTERYKVCAPQTPSVFWRPKDIPLAPQPRITPPA